VLRPPVRPNVLPLINVYKSLKLLAGFANLKRIVLCNRLRPLSSFFLSSLRGRQLLSCLALRPQIGPNALPLTNQNPTTKAKGYILLKKGKRKSKKHYPSYIKE